MDPAPRLPLPALLSQAFVAFTIELDNEFERRVPHRTSAAPGSIRRGPWLTSVAMWFTCMRYVDGAGITASELERRARVSTNLGGMERWGYVTVAPDPADRRPKPPPSSWLIRATAGGRLAREAWPPLFALIEERWSERFGQRAIDGLRTNLQTVVGGLDPDLPDCLPILRFGLVSEIPPLAGRARRDTGWEPVDELPLVSLLARVLLAFVLEFEAASPVSLAIEANVLRVLGQGDTRQRDLPRRSGISKEAIAMALGLLAKRGLVTIGADPAEPRTKVVGLTNAGRAVHAGATSLLEAIEDRRLAQPGGPALAAVRASLEPLVGDGGARSPLLDGLLPYADGWRATAPAPATLPHFPVVLHRGGYPDGS